MHVTHAKHKHEALHSDLQHACKSGFTACNPSCGRWKQVDLGGLAGQTE